MATLLDLSQYLSKVALSDVKQDDLRNACDNQVARIRQRTAQGTGYDLSTFAPYAQRSKKTPPVNLRKTGEMLDSIFIQSTDNSASIGFSSPDAATKAGYHNNGTSRMPARPFFGVSLSDKTEIISDIRQNVFRRVNT